MELKKLLQGKEYLVDEFSNEPFISIICYPKPDLNEAKRRIEELKSLGVSKVVFDGKTKIGNLCVLGKGCVSLVVKALMNSNLVALKIRRLDANRDSLKYEAKLLNVANSINVAPKLFAYSRNFIVMEHAEGLYFKDWIKMLKGKGKKERVKSVIKEILEQCFRLDEIGLDHGELSNIEKHIIVGKKAWIIDFESASMNRRASNLTKVTQYFVVGSPVSSTIRKLLRIEDLNEIFHALRDYKRSKSKDSFENVLRVMNLK
jgi:putative serine/threonine protein kinase